MEYYGFLEMMPYVLVYIVRLRRDKPAMGETEKARRKFFICEPVYLYQQRCKNFTTRKDIFVHMSTVQASDLWFLNSDASFQSQIFHAKFTLLHRFSGYFGASC